MVSWKTSLCTVVLCNIYRIPLFTIQFTYNTLNSIALYGEGGSPATAEPLLNQVVDIWGKQPADERAALFKVRGDCYLRLTRMDDAVRDYTAALDLLDSPEGELADPAERPAARLGRARAIMSIKGRVDGTPVTKEMARKAAEDYSISLKLSARDDDFDTDDEMIEDGAARNPYAAWEMGTARRAAGDFAGAYKAHVLASDSFENIGDHARSVISFLDAGIDLAAVGDLEAAKEILEPAIKSSVGVESNDVELLERVVSKEGEARIAYASILWNANDKSRAEAQLGEACLRLDQLEKDASERKLKAKKSDNMQIEDLGYSIDDIIPQGGEISCSRFKNEKFLSSTVSWPQSLKEKVLSLQKLK